jgi:hypothetical protein
VCKLCVWFVWKLVAAENCNTEKKLLFELAFDDDDDVQRVTYLLAAVAATAPEKHNSSYRSDGGGGGRPISNLFFPIWNRELNFYLESKIVSSLKRRLLFWDCHNIYIDIWPKSNQVLTFRAQIECEFEYILKFELFLTGIFRVSVCVFRVSVWCSKFDV